MKVTTSDKELIVYLNGQYVPESQAKISVFDHGFLYGDAVFDTWCAWHGGIFQLDAHLNRIFDSMQACMIACPLSKDEFRAALIETTRINGNRDAYIKAIVSRGTGPIPLLSAVDNITPTVVIFSRPYRSVVTDLDDPKGVTAKISTVQRIPSECLDPKIKSCNYLNHVLAYLDAKVAGFQEAIEVTTDGVVCEAPGHNLFIVKHGVVRTPDRGILMGVTRTAVLELAGELGLRCEIGPMSAYDVYTADEVFFSSTAGFLTSVVNVDGRRIGDGKPGPITAKLRKAYYVLLESGKYSTPVFGD
jgi:branched-chain amino acid aminotransferase